MEVGKSENNKNNTKIENAVNDNPLLVIIPPETRHDSLSFLPRRSFRARNGGFAWDALLAYLRYICLVRSDSFDQANATASNGDNGGLAA